MFINLYNGWTRYEWVLFLSSLLLIFLFTTLLTYFLTKDWKFIKVIILTYIISAVMYVALLVAILFLDISLSHTFLIPVLITTLLVTLNWSVLVTYYSKFKDRKRFSKLELIKEFKRDSIRNTVFLTISMLAATIFLKNELLLMLIISYVTSAVAIYSNSILFQRFIHD